MVVHPYILFCDLTYCLLSSCVPSCVLRLLTIMYRVKSSFERRVRERMGVLIELELVAYRLIHQSLDSSIYRASILEAWAWTSAGCAFVLSGRLSCYLFS